MARFPKWLLLIAVLAELMILTVASRTEMVSQFTEPAPEINVMSPAPALPEQAHSVKAVERRHEKAKTNKVVTEEFATAPQHVM